MLISQAVKMYKDQITWLNIMAGTDIVHENKRLDFSLASFLVVNLKWLHL